MASRSVLTAQVRKRSSNPAQCPHHHGNNVIFVCTRPGCDGSFACVKCVTTNHKGHDMEELASYAASKKQNLKNKIKAGKDGILNILLQNIQSTEQKIIENKTQTRDEQEKIIQRCNELKTELDKICETFLELRKKTGDENDRELNKHKEYLETLYTKYKAELEDCETATEEGSDSEIVVADREFPISPQPPNLPHTDDLLFKFRTIPYSQLEDWFGKLLSVKDACVTMTTTVTPSEEGATVSPSQNIQQMSEFVMKNNTSYVCTYIYPSLDQLYVWFSRSRTISLVNKHGKVTNTVTLQPGLDKRDYIQGVCVSPVDGTMWSVSDDTGTVQQVKQDGTLLQSFTQEDARSVCVTHSQSVLVGVRANNEVKISTITGYLTRTLTQQDTGLNGCPFYIVQCQKTGRVALNDNKAVSVLDKKYRRLYTLHGGTVTTADNKTKSTGYKPKEQFRPSRMCFDRDGDLLVSDINNYSVTLFSSSGQYIRTIIQETDKDKRPRVVNTTSDGALWVAHDNDVFKQIKYK